MTSAIRGDKISDVYRLMLLNAFLICATISMLLVLIYRLFNPISPIYIFIDGVASISFLGSFFYLRKSQNIEKISVFSSTIMVVLMIGFIHVEAGKSFGLVWTYMIPIYVILLNGFKKGGILTMIFYIGMFILYNVDYDEWVKNGWDSLSAIRYIITSTIVVLLCITYDYIFYVFQRKLHEQSATDALTGLNNRRNIDLILNQEIKKQKRVFTNLSFCIFDIDNFKSINDQYGHLVGDRVLKEIATLAKNNLRTNDIIGRWGGEEFCVISSNTSLDEAMVVFKRLRATIGEFDFKLKRNVTCSFGISKLKNDFDLESLISRADTLLYEAKNSGKNKICIEEDDSKESS